MSHVNVLVMELRDVIHPMEHVIVNPGFMVICANAARTCTSVTVLKATVILLLIMKTCIHRRETTPVFVKRQAMLDLDAMVSDVFHERELQPDFNGQECSPIRSFSYWLRRRFPQRVVD